MLITALKYLENLLMVLFYQSQSKHVCQCCFLSKTGISNIELNGSKCMSIFENAGLSWLLTCKLLILNYVLNFHSDPSDGMNTFLHGQPTQCVLSQEPVT